MPRSSRFVLFTICAVLVAALGACALAATTTAPTHALTTPRPPANPDLILATTTSTRDTGLLDVLLPMFKQQTGYDVKMVAVGSGQARQMGQDGNADVLLVHSPAVE